MFDLPEKVSSEKFLHSLKRYIWLKNLLLSYLHIVLYWVEGLHDEDAGHEPEPWWVEYMWCALRCWFTHCPVEMPGPQSFLHWWLQVCHEHGGGGDGSLPPPQDNTPPRALARRRTDKSSGRAISLRKERFELGLKDFVNECHGCYSRFGLNDIGDIEMLMNLHSCCAGRFSVTLAIVLRKGF